VAVVALIFAVVNGEHFSSYYLFYGGLGFAIFYVSSLRSIYERLTALLLRAAGYQRRARRRRPRQSTSATSPTRSPTAARPGRGHSASSRPARSPTTA